MATELKLRRDVEGDIDAMTPAEGEPIYDITNKRLRVGDGSVAGGLHLLAAADHQKQTFTYALVTGTDTLTASLSPGVASYVTGFKALIEIANNNTSAVTINFNALGAKTIKKNGGADDLSADDFVTGGLYQIAYDGINFQLLGAAPGFVVIDSGTVSNAASLDIINLSADYRAYKMVFGNLLAASDGADLWMRTDTNNGASFEAGASDYAHARIAFAVGGSATGAGLNADSKILIGTSFDSAVTGSGEITIIDPMNSGVATEILTHISYIGSTGNFAVLVSTGLRGVAEANNAIQLKFSTGNITSMEYTLYGLKAS